MTAVAVPMMRNGTCPPVEPTRSTDLSVQARETRWKRGDPPRGYPGERVRN